MSISLNARAKRARTIILKLKNIFPDAGMELRYRTNWELLVAVILSAQCTDKKVNEVTTTLFKKYRKLEDYVHANQKEFEQDIKPTGFYRAKARHILASARAIKLRHKGRVPRTMKELTSLPGVGRKTANVVLGNAYGIADGIAVDTHVKRLSYRLGLTNEKDPKKIEQDLMRIIPKKDWFIFTYLLIAYGRAYCPARPHNHTRCPLTSSLSSQHLVNSPADF